MDGRYVCWGSDQEDLTSQVEAAIKARPEIHVDVLSPEDVSDRASEQAIVVYCSKGDVNVFHVSKGANE